jgi:hypothetical protein
VVGVIGGDDEQSARLQLFCREVRRGTQKYDAVNLAWEGFDRCIARGGATEAAPDYGHRFSALRFQVANCGEHVVVKGGVIEIRLGRTARAAESAEVDCQDLESSGCQDLGLVPPAFLVESAAVGGGTRRAS